LPRYKTMQGYYAPRIAGWDTHGLPVELEVEKQLGFNNKADIEGYGIAKFNAKCRESVFRYLKDWDAITERIGFWIWSMPTLPWTTATLKAAGGPSSRCGIRV
jgi:isoleucyl-tRNA synthetase